MYSFTGTKRQHRYKRTLFNMSLPPKEKNKKAWIELSVTLTVTSDMSYHEVKTKQASQLRGGVCRQRESWWSSSRRVEEANTGLPRSRPPLRQEREPHWRRPVGEREPSSSSLHLRERAGKWPALRTVRHQREKTRVRKQREGWGPLLVQFISIYTKTGRTQCHVPNVSK